jgi:hypothetical protein
VHAVGIGDLPRGEAERRLDLLDAPDAGDEAEPFEVVPRSVLPGIADLVGSGGLASFP